MIHFIVYSRSYCHLCEDMLHALDAFRPEHDSSVEMVDVDADTALTERYDELVLVLLGKKSGEPTQQLCRYFLDVQSVQQFLLSESNICGESFDSVARTSQLQCM